MTIKWLLLEWTSVFCFCPSLIRYLSLSVSPPHSCSGQSTRAKSISLETTVEEEEENEQLSESSAFQVWNTLQRDLAWLFYRCCRRRRRRRFCFCYLNLLSLHQFNRLSLTVSNCAAETIALTRCKVSRGSLLRCDATCSQRVFFSLRIKKVFMRYNIPYRNGNDEKGKKRQKKKKRKISPNYTIKWCTQWH